MRDSTRFGHQPMPTARGTSGGVLLIKRKRQTRLPTPKWMRNWSRALFALHGANHLETVTVCPVYLVTGHNDGAINVPTMLGFRSSREVVG